MSVGPRESLKIDLFQRSKKKFSSRIDFDETSKIFIAISSSTSSSFAEILSDRGYFSISLIASNVKTLIER